MFSLNSQPHKNLVEMPGSWGNWRREGTVKFTIFGIVSFQFFHWTILTWLFKIREGLIFFWIREVKNVARGDKQWLALHVAAWLESLALPGLWALPGVGSETQQVCPSAPQECYYLTSISRWDTMPFKFTVNSIFERFIFSYRLIKSFIY